jgi:hypothetical protein
MEISQGKPLCISTKQKCHVYVFFLIFSLLQNWRIGEWNRSCPGRELVPVKGGGGRARGNMMNTIWCKYCVYVYINAKMIPVEIISKSVKGEIKDSGEGGEFKYDIFYTM